MFLLPQAVLILVIMKSLFTYFVLFVSLLLLQGCSLKHKSKKQEQKDLNYRNQEHYKYLLTKEHLILDTSLQYSHSRLNHYRIWHLAGNVKMHPDGSLQTDQAVIQTWHSEADSQQTTSLKITNENQRLEERSIKEESITLNKKSTQKEKRKFTTNLWWMVLLLIPVGFWIFRRRWL